MSSIKYFLAYFFSLVTRPVLWVVAYFSRRKPIGPSPVYYGASNEFKNPTLLDVEMLKPLDVPDDFFLPTKSISVFATHHRPADKVERANQKAALGVTWKKRVRCAVCKQLATRETSHRVDDKNDKHRIYVGDECCWETSKHIFVSFCDE